MDTKTDFNFNNIIATLSLISISSVKKFAGKCPDTYSNLISTPLDGCQSWWWASTLRATRPWRHNLCALSWVHCKTIDPYSTTSSESQESYLTTGMLPYKHSSFFLPTHGSIMLPPHQRASLRGCLVGNYLAQRTSDFWLYPVNFFMLQEKNDAGFSNLSVWTDWSLCFEVKITCNKPEGKYSKKFASVEWL